MMAGADFIKTSTGKEPVNATLPVGLVMVRAIRDYQERTGYKVGFKPAGGIRTRQGRARTGCSLMKEELGRDWLDADAVPPRRERAARPTSSASSSTSSPAATRPRTATPMA